MLGFNIAVVPIRVHAYLVTFNLILLAINPYLSRSLSIVTRFIIFVREAIYLFLKFDFP